MTTKVKVKKQNGLLESFDERKIKKVAIATGLENGEAGEFASKIRTAIIKKNKTLVDSQEIRELIIAELKKVNEYAYNKYIWWENYKDNNLNK